MQPCNEGASDLNVAHLAARVNVHQREVRSLLTFGRFDRHNMLVALGSNLQFGNRARILIALQFFVGGVLVVVMHGDVAAVLIGMAFQDFAISLQLAAVELNDFRRVIIGDVVGNHQLHPETLP